MRTLKKYWLIPFTVVGLVAIEAISPGVGKGLLILLAIAAGYFLPTIFALGRHKQNPGGVIVVNALLGWTVLGWIIALAWASSGPVERATDQTDEESELTTKKCPQCAEQVMAEAKICRYCGHDFTNRSTRLAKKAS